MEKYLAIITTVLVLTQVIRIIQNTINLMRNNKLYKKQLGDLAKCEPTVEDFEMQRKANRLIVECLEERKIERRRVGRVD